jgi:hypothetical protein
MYMSGGGGNQIQTTFKTKKAQGLTLSCTVNIETK